jgi:hypothetical protein
MRRWDHFIFLYWDLVGFSGIRSKRRVLVGKMCRCSCIRVMSFPKLLRSLFHVPYLLSFRRDVYSMAVKSLFTYSQIAGGGGLLSNHSRGHAVTPSSPQDLSRGRLCSNSADFNFHPVLVLIPVRHGDTD